VHEGTYDDMRRSREQSLEEKKKAKVIESHFFRSVVASEKGVPQRCHEER
jgi:hypothetical protein